MKDKPRTTILVVEDEFLVRMATMLRLQQAGYRVLDADSAEAARCALAEKHVDLVFSDIRLPGRLNGLGLAAWVKDVHPEVPILLTSARDVPHPHEHAFIEKPYRMADLLKVLAKLLEGK